MITKLRWIFYLVFIIFYLILLENLFWFLGFSDKLPKNVYIENEDYSFVSISEIKKNYAKKQLNLRDKIIEIKFPDFNIEIYTNSLEPEIDISEIEQFQKKIISPLFFPNRLKLYFGQKVNLNPKYTYKRQNLENILRDVRDKYYIPPENAKFIFKDGRVKEFKKEKFGQKLDEEKFWLDLEQVFNQLIKDPEVLRFSVRVDLKKIEPELTLEKTNSFGIRELIAVGTSDYTGSNYNREYNIILAASRINGVVIPKGEIFSFNKAVGDISAATGYKSSYVIKNGKTVLGDGGGVCQVSTTVFRAALNAGLEIIQRQNHSYRVSYYENDAKPGLDATVFAPYVDLKFKNNTPAGILLQTEIDKKKKLLYVYLYGRKDNRKVYLSDIKVWDVIPPGEPQYIEDPNLPAGVKKQIEYPAWGAKSRFTYRVEKDGKVIFEKTFYSVYKPWRAVYLVGTGS